MFIVQNLYRGRISVIRQEMSDPEPEPEVVQTDIAIQSGDEKLYTSMTIPQNQLGIWDEEAEKMGLNRSAAIRLWAAAGRRFLDQHDPDKILDNEADPLKAAVRRHVPKGEENAVSIDAIKETVIEEVEEEVWNVVLESDEIGRVKGNRFYKQ